MTDRRRFLQQSSLALVGAVLGQLSLPGCASRPAVRSGRELVDDMERRAFDFFWQKVNRRNGLVPNVWPEATECNLSTLGFALVTYALGVERGWIARAEARHLTHTTLTFLHGLPMGAASMGCAGYRGFHYHFLDLRTGLRATPQTEVSCIDVALLHLGLLFVATWYDRDDAGERAIRSRALELVDAAEWDWLQQQGRDGILPMGWTPEKGCNPWLWAGYSEAKGMYLLALASARHPIRADSWDRWTDTFASHWSGSGASRHLACAPLFTHHYSEMWIDFRGIQDALMRREDLDYFENSRRATYANRAYCIRNPHGWRGYSAEVWGLTASDGPGGAPVRYQGRKVQFRRYAMRGPEDQPGGFDDGTLSPVAVIGSLPFAPEICLPALRSLHAHYGHAIYDRYGFREAFNPSYALAEPLPPGVPVDAIAGWVGESCYSLEKGPVAGMIANHKDGAVWRVMRSSAHLIRGLRLAGFTGGWLEAPEAIPGSAPENRAPTS